MNSLLRKYKYTIDWINSKGEMVQNIVDAKSIQEAMKKLQILRGKKFSKNGFGKPRFVNIKENKDSK
mgnify:FL=1